MDGRRELLRIELAQLVKDQADAMEKKLTAAERRDSEKRKKRIKEVCDELRRIAPARTSDRVA